MKKDIQSNNKSEAVRGPELRKKIEESGEFGSQFRSEHNGADTIDTNVRHDKSTTQNRDLKEHSSKK